MRILVCSPHVPFPPVGGGRADVWRRIEAFVRLGHEVMLLHQYESRGPRAPLPQHFDGMDEVLTARFSFPIKRSKSRTVRQLLGIRRLPWHIAKAVPSGTDKTSADAQIRAFGPDLIWLEGPWLGEIARLYSVELGVPLAYRSHNIEHLYLARQARASQSKRNQIAWRLATVGLKQYELTAMRSAGGVFDISLDDMKFWQDQEVSNIGWLPPLPELALADPPTERVNSEVLFVGGLRLPNNVSGVNWLVDDVLPILHEARPDLILTIVGSGPAADLRKQLEDNPSVRTHFDVPSVNPYLFGAKVLVNPVSIGSGVQLKMLDMLMTDAPIVTRSQGSRGLPDLCTSQFEVADTKEEFASSILQGLEGAELDAGARQRARSLFTLDAVKAALASMELTPR